METAQTSSSGLTEPGRSTGLPGLHIAHRLPQATDPLRDRHTLAVIGFGRHVALADDPRCLRIALEPLHSPAPFEVWRTQQTVACGREGRVAWSSDGNYSFASLELHEAAYGGIAGATREAYRVMQSWCRSSATPHLLRVWNYLDAINTGDGDNERYRLFCSGRAAGMSLPVDAAYPAATAIGVRDGRRCLQLCWLAARCAGSPWENPRQLSAWRYPRRYGPVAPGFARGMRAPTRETQLFVSGTAAVVGHASHHAGDACAQTGETLANLDSLLAAAGVSADARYGAGSLWRVYVRHAADAKPIERCLRTHFPPEAELLLLNGDICRAELVVEIDGVHGV